MRARHDARSCAIWLHVLKSVVMPARSSVLFSEVAGAVFGLAGTYELASRHVPQLRSQLSALGWKEQKVRLATRSDARRTEGDAGGGHEVREETAGDRSRSRSR